jgi:hypothetical protein
MTLGDAGLETKVETMPQAESAALLNALGHSRSNEYFKLFVSMVAVARFWTRRRGNATAGCRHSRGEHAAEEFRMWPQKAREYADALTPASAINV